MKIIFWLLDINPKIDGDKVELWVWGIDESGNRVLIIERNFTAYFYAVLAGGSDPQKVSDEMMNHYGSLIFKTEIVERFYFGKPVKAIKVSCRDATQISKLAKQLRSLQGVADCLEDDIRAAMRYLIDNSLSPCSWHQVEVDQETNMAEIRIAKIYVAKFPPELIENVLVPSLRVLGFTMVNYSREGSPKSDRNPILILSIAVSNDEVKQFIVDEAMDDKPVLQNFIDYIKTFDPDVIVGFGVNTVDWNYLKGRCHKLGLHLNFDRTGQEPHTSMYGHVSTTGIVNIDLADFMSEFKEIKVETLWNLADHLGVDQENVTAIDDVLLADYWDDKQKREELKRYAWESARKIYGSVSLLLDFAIQLSALTSLPLDQVMAAATGFRIEWFLIKQAQKNSELIPRRTEQQYAPYAGGIVLSPKSGLHDDIAVLDFKSMYPNLMIAYNISPDTYIEPGMPEPESGVYIAPEVKYRFRKFPPGFYKEALTYLIDVRTKIRQKMETLDRTSLEYRIFDARQKAVKIITNAAYGYSGWVGARWYIKPVAEAAAAWGRKTIQTAIDMAQKAGLEVVYGDTDSLFIHNIPEKTQQLREAITRQLKLDVEVSEVYQRIFFTEAKKRYAGLRQDGSFDIVGLEVIRGDWSEVAKKVQEHVIKIILKEQSATKAIQYVKQTVSELKHRKTPLNDLIIWKTLTKAPEDYAIKAPHVEAAKMLKAKGWRLTGGDKVGYVVLAGKGRLYSRVKPYVFAHPNEVDVEYYINNQVLPAAYRILAYFDVTTNELLKETKETQEIRSLMDYV